MTIFMGCPMQPSKSWIIPYYLSSLERLEYPKKDIHLGFLVNHPHDENHTALTPILEKFRKEMGDKYKAIDVWVAETNFDEQGRIHGRWFAAFSNIRNIWVKMRNLDEDDYIFSVDSDILLAPNTVKRLLSWIKNKDYDAVAALISNGPTQDGTEAFNFMSKLDPEKHKGGETIYTHRPVGVLETRATWSATPNKQGLYQLLELPEVPMTGAVVLYKREIPDSGVLYGYHPQGEDCYWSERSIENGFHLYVDFSTQANHIMSPAALQQVVQPPLGFVVKPPVMDEHLTPPTGEPDIKVVEKW